MADNSIKLGSLIYGNVLPPRDAVHIAIIPGVSNDCVKRADFVKYNPETQKFDKCRQYEADGVVDAFLNTYPDSISPGTSFWVMLNPGSILSLRHSWVHKTIPPENTVVDKTSYSRSWLEGFAETADMSYNGLMYAAEEYLENHEYVCNGGKYESFDFPDAFWDHYTNVTGKSIPESKRYSFFSCSC